MTDGVVILHGIFRTRRSMRKLAAYLESQQFKVLNLGYPSTRHDLVQLADWIDPAIRNFSEKLDGKLHFVGYSMGGLLIRAYICKYRPANLGRIVMIGTPNSGSEIADYLKNWWIYKKLYGPAGQQLITDQKAFSHLFGETAYECAVIAGNRTIDPLGSWIIGRPNDGKVAIENTKLAGMKAHKVMPANHTFFPNHRPMWEITAQFLKTGTMG
jgi:pimeloyl-ACP methyl ester carboxylesterase